MRDHRVRPYPVEFARQRALGELTRWSHFTDYGPVGVFFPGLDDVRHHGCILAEHIAEDRRLERGRRKAVDLKRHRLRITQGTDQRLMFHEVLQHALGPRKKVMSRMHPKRGIHVELERFELKRVQ